MIEALLAPPTTEEAPSHTPDFRVNSPSTNPFIVPGPINVIRSNDHFDIEWGDEELVATQASADFTDDALYHSERDVERHPRSSRARTNLAVALMNAGRLDDAIREFETVLGADPDHYPALAHLIRARFLEGHLSDAAELAADLQRRFPSDAVAPMMFACLAIRQNQPLQAIEQLTHAASLDTRSALPRYLMGMVLLGLRREQEAISQLKIAVRLESRSPVLQRSLGVAYAARGDLARAIRAFKTSLTLDPNAAETVHALARVLITHGDIDAAVEVLSEHVAHRSGDRVGQELLAQAYGKQQQFRAVKRHLLRALNSLEGDESPEAITERARLMNNVGAACASYADLDEAERWYLRSVAIVPHSVPFQNLYGVYHERGDFVSCRHIVNRWLDAIPGDKNAEVLSAINRAETGERDRGIRELRGIIATDGTNPRAYSALGWLLTDHQRDLDGALDVLLAGFERFPRESAIINNLAYVRLMRGEPNEARAVLETLTKGEIDHSVFLTATWGLLLLWEGHVSDAIERYRVAAETAKRMGRVRLGQRVRQKMHLELARYFTRIGEPKRAALEVKQGLASRGDRAYQDDLKQLQEQLLLSDGN